MKKDKMSWFGLGICVGVMIMSLMVTLSGCGNRPVEKKTEEPLVKGIETEEILVEDIQVEEIIVEETIEEKPVYWYLAIRFINEDGESYYRDIILDGEPLEIYEADDYHVNVTYTDGHKVSCGFTDVIGGTKVWHSPFEDAE